MSYVDARSPACSNAEGSIELRISPKEKDLGEFTVRRVLPSPQRKMVGPFIFFDHMGPAEFRPGQGIQVRPHPHIGIATITYLFDGEIMHHDSLGYSQPIHAGAVNLMTAGRGIVHSERAGSDLDTHSTLHGIQSWMALPTDKEDIEPAFRHYPANELPQLTVGKTRVTVIIGEAFGKSSPVTTYAPMLYLECRMEAGSTLDLPDNYRELAAYVVSGSVVIDEREYEENTMAVASDGARVRLEASEESRVMVIGGEPVGERHIWWNFVSSSRDRIDAAKKDWKAGNFDPVPGDDEFIPLPEVTR